jgi:transposase InsO family protein
LKGFWIEPDVRDEIIEYVSNISIRSHLTKRWCIKHLGISASRYYEWLKRQGVPNRHNGIIPKAHWILPEEVKAIVEYCRDKIMEGYRRLTYMMIDKDIAFVSPATTYRVLKAADLLNRWAKGTKTNKGRGFVQPFGPHAHWHIDIAYINILGTFFFLISILDGFSRMILHHELRTHMKEYDVEITLRRAKEKYPEAKCNLISDNGCQFISKDFKDYIRESGLKHIRTSIAYPQSNGRIERFHGTIKKESIRKSAYTDIKDARNQITEYISYYNEERLHSAISL